MASRSRSKRKRKQRDCCAICGEVFPLATHYDAESYEQILLNHMLKCSASPTPSATRRTTSPLQDDRKPAAKKLKTDDDRKPAAINIPKNPSFFSECETTKSHSVGGGSVHATPPTTVRTEKVKKVLPIRKNGISVAKSPKPIKKLTLEHSSSSQTSNDTAETACTTKESSSTTTTPISVSSDHFLAQTWWREKTVRRNPGVSIPFSIESCVTISKSNADKINETVPKRQLRHTARRRAETLVLSCPICHKSFNKSNMTEDAMSRHVERCTKEHLSETRPRQTKQETAADSTKKVNMARNLAFVAAMSRPRNQETRNDSRVERERAENERQARLAAEVAAQRASMHFLTYGAGERALNNWVLRDMGKKR